MVDSEGVEDQMNVNLFLLLVDDIVGSKLDVWQEHLARTREAFLELGARSEVTIGGEVIRDSKDLHVRFVQPLAVLIPHVCVIDLELIVEFSAGRMKM
jgi:hypothetical protein